MPGMSSRSLICCLLAAGPPALLLAGCDRKSDAPAQQQASANVAAADEVTAPPKGAVPAKAGIDRSRKGEAAPPVAFEGPDGKPATLAAFGGAPVLVNLWATWCGPCVAELPTLDALGRSGKVRVVAVSQDLDPAKVAPFLSARGLALTAYRDPKLALSLAYGANLPTTILYDAAGREVWRMTGGYEWNTPAAAALIAEARR